MPYTLQSNAPLIDWAVSPGLTSYPEAQAFMEARVEAIIQGRQAEMVWLLEHPPLYTKGTSAREKDLLDAGRFPVFKTGRGGAFTYHGPGQRVAYLMLDLNRRGRDIRAFIRTLEAWIIETLAIFGIQGLCHSDRPGVWVAHPRLRVHPPEAEMEEDKIAALGVRVRRWVSFHGIALNIAPDLDAFSGIIPCGYRQYGVTSLHALGKTVTMADVDAILRQTFENSFNLTQEAKAPVFNKGKREHHTDKREKTKQPLLS